MTPSGFFFPVALQPKASHGLLILEVSRSHTATHHSRYDFSGRLISPSQRSLSDNTQQSTQKTSTPPAGFEPQIPASKRTLRSAIEPATFRFVAQNLNHCVTAVLITKLYSSLFLAMKWPQATLQFDLWSI